MSDPTNAERANRGADILGFYSLKHGEMIDDQTTLADVLADLMHLAYSQRGAEDCPMDFQRALRIAEMHFEAEQTEEQP